MAQQLKLLPMVLPMLLVFGCASTPVQEEPVDPSLTPTHRWVSDLDVSHARYNFDNTRCAEEAAMGVVRERHADSGSEAIRRTDPEFQAYERCMQSRGYTLATY